MLLIHFKYLSILIIIGNIYCIIQQQVMKKNPQLKNVSAYFNIQNNYMYEVSVPIVTTISDILNFVINSAKLDNKYKAYCVIYNSQQIPKTMHISDLQTGVKARYDIMISKNKPTHQIQPFKISSTQKKRSINTFLPFGQKPSSKIIDSPVKQSSSSVKTSSIKIIKKSPSLSLPFRVEAYDGQLHPNNLYLFNSEKYPDMDTWSIKKIRSKIGVKKSAYVILDNGKQEKYEDIDFKLTDIFSKYGLNQEKDCIKIQFK